jgi:hypothetical protein
MAETSKRSLAEIFRPSKEVRETIAAGSNYEPGKTAIQYYGMVEKKLKQDLELANATISAYRALGYDTQIDQETNQLIMTIPSMDDINALIKQMVDTTEFLAACRDSKQATKALATLGELKLYEENHTNKKGLAELRGLLAASDALTAATLTEESH